MKGGRSMRPVCWLWAQWRPSSQRTWRTAVSSLTCMDSWRVLSWPISTWLVSFLLVLHTRYCGEIDSSLPSLLFASAFGCGFIWAAASPFLLGRALWAASRFTAAMSPELIQQFLQATVSGLHVTQPPSVRISAVRAIWGWANHSVNVLSHEPFWCIFNNTQRWSWSDMTLCWH